MRIASEVKRDIGRKSRPFSYSFPYSNLPGENTCEYVRAGSEPDLWPVGRRK